MGKYFRSQLSHNHFIFIRMRYLVSNIWLIVIMMILCWMHWHLSYGKVCLMWYELVLKSIYYQFMSSMLSHIFHRSSPSTTQITQKHSTHNNPIPHQCFLLICLKLILFLFFCAQKTSHCSANPGLGITGQIGKFSKQIV